MMPDSSVTTWIGQVKLGDNDAAQKLWERYHLRLLDLARRLLRFAERRASDEEDVVLEVFDAFIKAAAAGQLTRLTDRDDFWALVCKMTENRARDHRRHQRRLKRGGGKVRGESALAAPNDSAAPRGIDQIADERPTANAVEALLHELCQMFERLGETLVAQAVELRVAGWKHEDIAKKLNVAEVTVRRKLRVFEERLKRELAE